MAYTEKQRQKIFDDICVLVSEGMSLKKAKTISGTDYKSVWDKMLKKEENNTKYARACEERALCIFEETMEIADKQDKDVSIDKDGNEVINHNLINRNRLQVDTRKWFLSKLMPKKYGDKLQLDQNIKDETPKININVDGKEIDVKI
jgi:hypothetical protein